MKVTYIDTEELYQDFFHNIKNKDIIIHYSTISQYDHSAINEITLLSCFIQDLNIMYILLLNHNEALLNVIKQSLISDIISIVNKIYVYDKKEFLHLINIKNSDKIIDISLLYYFNYTEQLEISNIENSHTLYKDYEKVSGKIIPSVKLVENCQHYTENIIEQINRLDLNEINNNEFNFYNNDIIPNLCEIESSGLYVDSVKFIKHFNDKEKLITDKNLVYSKYNLYTATGRPSNNYGGVNYAALEKKDGTRESFISRFPDGYLLEFDFDGYHLKLISKLIEYEIPEDLSIHEYLGRYYFDTDKLTAAQYKESKEISFKIIYGGHSKDFQEIPYFKNVFEYIDKLWLEFNINKFIKSPISGKIIKKNSEKTNKNKFFNYIIQLLETEYSMIVVKDLLQLIEFNKLKSKLVLYTYDSFLFDCSPEDITIVSILKEQLKKYKIGYKIKKGINYQKLELIS